MTGRTGIARAAPFNGVARQDDGLTVFVSDAADQRRSLARRGMPLREALREICDMIDSWGGTWRIDCISTPTTIWRDLQGSRKYQPSHLASDGKGTDVATPERAMLNAIGRMDLLR